MIRFGMIGAMGRMGRTISNLSVDDVEVELGAAFEHEDNSAIGKDYGETAGIPGLKKGIEITTLSEESAQTADLQGIIDFSTPGSTLHTIEVCRAVKIPLVIGTTGWSDEQRAQVEKAGEDATILLGSNMSIGVNLLFALVRQAAKSLHDKNFAPEMTEIHHRFKRDAPSGTARSLEEIILEEYNWASDSLRHGREGIIGERPEKEVGSFALRGGDVVGDHTVFFLGEGERIELKHQAVSRNTFAAGAIAALKFLQNKPAGLYTMKNVLGL